MEQRDIANKWSATAVQVWQNSHFMLDEKSANILRTECTRRYGGMVGLELSEVMSVAIECAMTEYQDMQYDNTPCKCGETRAHHASSTLTHVFIGPENS